MGKALSIISILFLVCIRAIGQNTTENIIYIIDSIPVINDPEEGNDILDSDIEDLTVIRNRDSLKLLGFEKFDAAFYIFTKEYRKRSEDLKKIPSSKQMEKRIGTWFYRGNLYSGKFIDYYYSGRKEGEGILKNGRAEGLRKFYYQTGVVSGERYYSNGIENGTEKEFYEDGSLKQKGDFLNGKEDGIWEMYFPNGQVKQKSTFRDGAIEGETAVYYSSGKVLAVEVTKNGKTAPDKNLEKINSFIGKGNANNKEENYKGAVKNYSKAIEIDSTYAEAYFARGTAMLNDFQFDEAIADFNKALKFEPYYEEVLANRAFARIRKYQFGSNRELSSGNGIKVMASKNKPEIPERELAIICNDLKQAIFLGDKSKMIMDAVDEFCGTKSSN